MNEKRSIIPFALYGLAFSACLILSAHIHIEGDPSDERYYGGTIYDNYITPYSLFDFILWIVLAIVVTVIALAVFRLISNRFANSTPVDFAPIGIRRIVLLAVALWLAWLPYLLAYWPGFVFGDSLVSIYQAYGMEEWSNHYPVLYTCFIKLCLDTASFFGRGITAGIALYSVLQMTFMACCLSYASCWVVRRCRLKPALLVVFFAIFGLVPYFATYSIAMWKDPIFSCALVVLTTLMADLVLGARLDKRWLACYCLFMLIMIFSRNNGIYIALCCLAATAVVSFAKRGTKSLRPYRNASIVACAVVIAAALITGPLYTALGLQQTKAESYGVFINQMARVVVLDGDMSDDDEEYMDELLPLEVYDEAYRPRCVDPVKWDDRFDDDVLERDFMEHCISMFLRNPIVFLEGWELTTYGFWTVDHPEIIGSAWNIAGGVPRNTHLAYASDALALGITFDNLLGDDSVRGILIQDMPSIPLGWINWFVLFICCCMIAASRGRMIVPLIPSIALFATLALASPIFYWARYGAAAQFLLPVFIALLWLTFNTAGEQSS